jgi:hypothetical protein
LYLKVDDELVEVHKTLNEISRLYP